jgi:phage tail sheath protein FI
VVATVEAFLNVLWLDGGLFGASPAEAYYVRCDEELNPEASRNQGRLICEVGYAGSKPAEFVIFRVSHEIPKN